MPSIAAAQLPAPTGYYQNVFVQSAAGAGMPAGALDAQRARIMWTPAAGAFALDAAYEHTLRWRDGPTASAGGGLLSSTQVTGDWLPLGWTIHDGTRVDWRQRLDRLAISWSNGSVTATVGRQAVSWATTLLLTPADPFAPFDPADPFRDYRAGVDAARLQWFPGPFSVVDIVVRGEKVSGGDAVTALARGKATLRGWDLSAWGGAVHGEPGGALGLTRTVAGSAVRAEVEFRRDTAQSAVARLSVGVDRRFGVFDRSMYVVWEYQHDPFGAARATDLATVAQSLAAGRRELQVLGRDESVVQLSYQVHPLVSAEFTTLWNLRDGSTLLGPAAAVSVSDAASARLGVFLPTGAGFRAASGPRSEYGSVPVTGYLALSVFF